jgi:hypothetical protein
MAMTSARGCAKEPEINLIPFIDVLLVVLIFLMLTTTYSKYTELQLKLPVADAEAQRDYPKEVIVVGRQRRALHDQPQSGGGDQRGVVVGGADRSGPPARTASSSSRRTGPRRTRP